MRDRAYLLVVAFAVARAVGCGGSSDTGASATSAASGGGASASSAGAITSSGASQEASSGAGGATASSSSAGGSGGSGGHMYTTKFPLQENPVAENGAWIGGHAAGKACNGGFCWGNVETTPGFAFGVDEPTQFGDPTAILTGAWGPDQTVTATVKAPVPAPNGGCCMEAEVRLRFSISAGVATGYEVYCSILDSNKYCHVASWGGPDGAYVNLDGPQWDSNNPECPGFPVTGPLVLKDGDVLSATASGSNPVTVTGYINGSAFVTVVDKGQCHFNPPNSGPYGPWPAGSPGMGFFGSGFDTFGFTDFTASD